MSAKLTEYFEQNGLFDEKTLRERCQKDSVYYITSPRFPNLVMLHYADTVQYDNLWTEFSRFSRGLILDMTTHKVIAHPFDKFFNLGQMPETQYEDLVKLGGFQTSEKLDGSMVICFPGPYGVPQFTTKGSFDSGHGVYAATLPAKYGYKYDAFEHYAKKGTLVFELIAKRFQIVIDYEKKGCTEGLYLIGYRDHATGKLASFLALEGIAEELGVPMYKTFVFDSLDALIENSKTLSVREEGFVIRFQNDLLVKIKGAAYLEMHRFISHLSDRNILEAVGNGTATTLSALCPEEYKTEVEDKIEHYLRRCSEVRADCADFFAKAPQASRKEFALWVNRHVPQPFRGFLFHLMDKKPLLTPDICRLIKDIDKVDGKTKI